MIIDMDIVLRDILKLHVKWYSRCKKVRDWLWFWENYFWHKINWKLSRYFVKLFM